MRDAARTFSRIGCRSISRVGTLPESAGNAETRDECERNAGKNGDAERCAKRKQKHNEMLSGGIRSLETGFGEQISADLLTKMTSMLDIVDYRM